MTGLTRYSDTSGADEVLSTAYTYDAANNLTGISHETPGSTVVASYSYTLDPADRLTEEVHSWGSGSSTDTTDYTYTANNQLTGVTHSNSSFANESFSYDSNGNRTMTGYTTGTGNELTSDGTYDYTYDANGNMITKTDIATGDELIYTYDFRNRLVEVDQVVGGDESTLATYGYDLLNRRVEVTEGGNTTFTVYHDPKSTVPLLDFDWSGDLTARYLGGPTPSGVDAVLARDTPSGGVAWYLTDRLGTVGDLVNNSGTVIDHIDYSAFGQVLAQTNSANGDRFTFAGMQYDATTQMYFDQARYYDASSGRFISQDPLQFQSNTENFYAYTSNSPTDFTDPSGLGAWGVFGGLAGGGFGGALGSAIVIGIALISAPVSGPVIIGTIGASIIAGAVVGGLVGSSSETFGGGFASGVVPGIAVGVTIANCRIMLPRILNPPPGSPLNPTNPPTPPTPPTVPKWIRPGTTRIDPPYH
jgi:RHS repeat-associated protein